MSKEARFTQQPPKTATTKVALPRGACDCHAHIFPGRDLYPTENEGMPLAPVEFYLDIHSQLGFERGVLVQGGAYKFDNRAMLDALARYPDTLRGVALVPADCPPQTLEQLAASQVKALRFTNGGASRIDGFAQIAPVMKDFALHAEMFLGLDNFLARAAGLRQFGVSLVLDHLAGPFDPQQGVDSAAFRNLLSMLGDGDIWVKLSPQRNSRQFPRYGDVRPFQDALVAAAPDRLVWGSDWPFPNMSEETPDIGALVDLFGDWVSDTGLRRRILVDNPARLYGFA